MTADALIVVYQRVNALKCFLEYGKLVLENYFVIDLKFFNEILIRKM